VIDVRTLLDGEEALVEAAVCHACEASR